MRKRVKATFEDLRIKEYTVSRGKTNGGLRYTKYKTCEEVSADKTRELSKFKNVLVARAVYGNTTTILLYDKCLK